MRVLLDTNIVYWWFYESFRLSPETVSIVNKATSVFISSASIWEISIKVRLGKMEVEPTKLLELINATDFIELPVTFHHAVLVADLPLLHADPFDRLLVAQAMREPLHLITSDRHLKQYSELVIEV